MAQWCRPAPFPSNDASHPEGGIVRLVSLRGLNIARFSGRYFVLPEANPLTRRTEVRQNFRSISAPAKRLPRESAAIAVEPEPMNGSSTRALTGVSAEISRLANATG